MAYILLIIFIAAVILCVLRFRREKQSDTDDILEDIREHPYDYAEEIRLLRCKQYRNARNGLLEDGYSQAEAKEVLRCLEALLEEGALEHYYAVDMEYVDSMSGRDFERFVANLLYRSGYTGVRITPASNDQGVDILAELDGERLAFQCKCYGSDLNNKAIQEVTAGKSFWGCDRAIVVTNAYFNQNARRIAETTDTELWDRDVLMKMIADAQ